MCACVHADALSGAAGSRGCAHTAGSGTWAEMGRLISVALRQRHRGAKGHIPHLSWAP